MVKELIKPIYPPGYMSDLAKKSHEARMKKYGKKYYSELGKKSAAKRKAKREAELAAKERVLKEKKHPLHQIGKFLEHGL